MFKLLLCLFFFQAEDGIRDRNVTGVQTCALPISTIRELHEQYKPIVLAAVMEDVPYRNACGHSDHENAVIEGNAAIRRAVLGSGNMELLRSEERRVGKEERNVVTELYENKS